MMKIKDRIEFKSKPPVLTFKQDEKVITAIKIMSEKNYGASVIVDEKLKPIGIITERDFLRRLLAKKLDAETTLIKDIMTTDLKIAVENDSVVEWLRVMSNERFRHLPVVNKKGKLKNIMSQGDFVSYTWPLLIDKLFLKIKETMEFKNKPPVLTFKAHQMVLDAVQMMSEKNYGSTIIVDEDYKPIGIVTERDFMRRLLAKGLDQSITPLNDIMTTQLRIAQADDGVVDWLRIMSNERFRHLPVVDANGKLLNVISQGDFVSLSWPQLLGKLKDAAVKSFMERFHLHIIFGSILIYTIIMTFVVLHVLGR
jgi:CBS domain-containing protein